MARPKQFVQVRIEAFERRIAEYEERNDYHAADVIRRLARDCAIPLDAGRILVYRAQFAKQHL